MSDYSRYSKDELERMKRDNERSIRDPYEQDKWVEKEMNEDIERELRSR